MASCNVLLVALVAILPVFTTGDTCLSPEVNSKVHTSTDATVSQDTAVVVELSLKCKNGIKDQMLYAELQGNAIPASKIQGAAPNSYQVSYSHGHKEFPSGTYSVRFFDEEGYSILRKAQRNGEDIGAIKSLFDVAVNHPGASKGMYIQSEFIAAVISVCVFYIAYSARNKLQSN